MNTSQSAAVLSPLNQAAWHEVLGKEKREFSIGYFGRRFGDEREVNWRLPCPDTPSTHRVGNVLRALGATRYVAPNTSQCNAKYAHSTLFGNRLSMEADIGLYGNKDEPVDTVLVERGEGVVMNPAGCGLACAVFRDTANVSHVSRRSLIDVQRMLNDKDPWRRYATVMETLLWSLGCRNEEKAKETRIWLRCFIPVERIPYTTTGTDPWANHNRTMRTYIAQHWGDGCIHSRKGYYYLDLAHLARLQLEKLGVPPENINSDNAHISGDVWLEGKVGDPRNLLVAVRH